MIEFGDCRQIMRKWASEGVKAQMCVTVGSVMRRKGLYSKITR